MLVSKWSLGIIARLVVCLFSAVISGCAPGRVESSASQASPIAAVLTELSSRTSDEELYWKGTVDGKLIKWTNRDITIASNGSDEFPYRFSTTVLERVRDAGNAYLDMRNGPFADIRLEVECSIRSVVGTVVSFELSHFWISDATADPNVRLVVVDLSRPSWKEDLDVALRRSLFFDNQFEGKVAVSLLDFYSDAVLLRATRQSKLPSHLGHSTFMGLIDSAETVGIDRHSNPLILDDDSLKSFYFRSCAKDVMTVSIQVWPFGVTKIYELSTFELRLPPLRPTVSSGLRMCFDDGFHNLSTRKAEISATARYTTE